MFDIGWSELLIIGVVALIVIGPKDLPEMFRTLGRFTAKARSMARDFQRAMDAAAKDSGVADAARDVKNMASPKNLGLDAVRDAAARFEKWDPLKPTPKPAPTPAAAPVAASPASAPMGPATAALAEAKAQERAALAASVDNRNAPPAMAAASAATESTAASLSVAPKKTKKGVAPEPEPAAQPKPRKARKSAAKAKGDA